MPRNLVLALSLVAAVPAQAPSHTSGDMVGWLRPDGALVWTRAAQAAKVSVVYATRPNLTGALETTQVLADYASDYTAKLGLNGLQPGTRYFYATRLQDPASTAFTLGPIATFRTPPLPTQAVACSFAFSGDVAVPAECDLFDQITALQPDFYVATGDFPYCDPAATVTEYRDRHKGIRGHAVVQRFFRSVGLCAVWDDHEVANDWDAGTDPIKVKNGTDTWREYFPHPHGTTEIYRSQRWGRDLEVFLLDTRSHRGLGVAPDLPAKTMLGAAQKAWLLQGLAQSNATFKVVVSSVPLRYGHGIGDSWWGFQRERKEILDFVTSKGLANVVFVSADNHFAAVHHLREGVREYQVGPVAQFLGGGLPDPDPEVRERRFERNFGRILIDPGGAVPRMTIEVHGVNGVVLRETLDAAPPARLTITTDLPEARWSSGGAFFARNQGRETVLPHVEPGVHALSFLPAPFGTGQPLPIAVKVPPGGDVRVAAAYRDTPTRNPLLYAAEFEAPLTGWNFVDAGAQAGPSAWYLDNGYLYQSSDIGDGSVATLEGTLAVVGDPLWTDYTLSVRARSFDDDVFGVLFRWRDAANGYRFTWDRERPGRMLWKKVAGVWSVLAQDAVPYEQHRWYDVQIVAVGARLRVFVDSALVFDVQDTAHPRGAVGLATWSNQVTSFDDLIVRQGDALAAGQLHQLRETFTIGNLPAWTVLDQSATNGPSAWRTSEGRLLQTSNIGEAAVPPFEVAQPGTLLLAGQPTWTDYRVTANLRSDDDDALGIVFRYGGPGDFYRFAWDRQRALRRLTRVVGGVWTVLKEDQVPYEHGRWYRIACEVEGARLRVFVDGAPWADLQDSAHAQGLIGLYCCRNSAACFDDVEVTPPIPPRPVLAVVLGPTTQIRARSAQGAGLPYLLALAQADSPGIPLALLQPGDPRIWPLRADPLFFASLGSPALWSGFAGTVAPDGTLQATMQLPALPGLSGMRFHLGGIVMTASRDRILEILPTVPLVWP